MMPNCKHAPIKLNFPKSVDSVKNQTFGLQKCLQIPIAAASLEVLESVVGIVEARRVSRDGRVNAVLIKAHPRPSETCGVGLWESPLAPVFRDCLRPPYQVWVHVDYHSYRAAWRIFGMPDPGADFLDHICNRRAIRLRRYAHPYLRLCPVSRLVNTSAGAKTGGEGMEHDFAANITQYSEEIQEEFWKANEVPIVLADPMDLTKMLNIGPGTGTLSGVRDTQGLFYP